MKVIGGFFCDEFYRAESKSSATDSHIIFPDKILERRRQFFETGTDAVAAYLNATSQEGHKFFVPKHFCHESLFRIRKKISKKWDFVFYSELNFKPVPGDVVFIVHFNRLDLPLQQEGLKLKQQTNCIVFEDFVQAPFDVERMAGDAAVVSFRKVTDLDLSILYSDYALHAQTSTSRYFKLSNEAKRLKRDGGAEHEYLELNKNAESHLATDSEIRFAQESEILKFFLTCFGEIRKVRRSNLEFLSNLLRDTNGIEILPSRDMYLMIRTSDRDDLRKFLFSNSIFPAVHWLDARTDLSHTILSLHIDQRYGEEDMMRTAKLIKEFKAG